VNARRARLRKCDDPARRHPKRIEALPGLTHGAERARFAPDPQSEPGDVARGAIGPASAHDERAGVEFCRRCRAEFSSKAGGRPTRHRSPQRTISCRLWSSISRLIACRRLQLWPMSSPYWLDTWNPATRRQCATNFPRRSSRYGREAGITRSRPASRAGHPTPGPSIATSAGACASSQPNFAPLTTMNRPPCRHSMRRCSKIGPLA
jgi:hypothetical protein